MTGKKFGKKWIFVFVGLFIIGVVIGVAVKKNNDKKEDKAMENPTQSSQSQDLGEMKDGELVDYEKNGTLTLENYIGVEGTVTPTKEEVYQFILNEVETKKVKVTGEERVKKGDWVMMDYQGAINGQEDENLGEEGIVFQVGSGDLFNADFERRLTGLSLGQEYTFDVDFPQDYFDVDVAGQKVTFTVEISYKFNKSFVETLSKGKYKTEKEYYEYAKEKEKKQNIEGLGDTIWDEYLEKCDVKKYPKGSKKQAYADLKMQYKGIAKFSGSSYEEVIAGLGMSDDDVKSLAEDEVKGRMVAKTIAVKENLSLSDEQYRKYLEEEVSVEDENSVEDMKLADMEKDYKENTSAYPRDDMLIKLVKEYIGKKAKQV